MQKQNTQVISYLHWNVLLPSHHYALNIETDELPQDFYQTYLKKINAVTAEDIQRVAQKYYLADNARIVVVGKGSEVAEGLGKSYL